MECYIIEDFLMENECFVNGLDNRIQDPFSYLTVLDYEKLYSCFKEFKKFPKELIDEFLEVWKYQSYLSPIVSLTVKEITRLLELSDEEVEILSNKYKQST